MGKSLDIGNASIAKIGEELCGDVIEIEQCADSTVIVISDGLGSGVKANILAKLTAKIAARLLTRGVALPEVVETITETLPVCQVRQLAYSTFTITQFFECGLVYVAQYDNPPVLLVRGREIIPLQGTEKKIENRKIIETSMQMQEGDMLIMVSDGVTHAGIGALLPLGLGNNGLIQLLKTKIDLTKSSQTVAEQITEFCEAYSAMYPGDDITTVVVKLRESVKGVLLSGPPLAKENDPFVVEEFFTGNKRKAICGGTTANIVAREKNLKLDISHVYYDTMVPPIARLPGVDLVTEGILTLTRVVEMFETGDIQNSKKKDGASQLFRWLLDCDELEMLVGLSVNPAHLEGNLPFHLGLRVTVLQRLKDLLAARGKKVTIRWF